MSTWEQITIFSLVRSGLYPLLEIHPNHMDWKQMTCSSKEHQRNLTKQKFLFDTRNFEVHYPRLISFIYRSNHGLCKNTGILISVHWGLSAIHVVKYPLETNEFPPDKPCQKKPGSLTKYSVLNINLKEVKTHVYAPPAQ